MTIDTKRLRELAASAVAEAARKGSQQRWVDGGYLIVTNADRDLTRELTPETAQAILDLLEAAERERDELAAQLAMRSPGFDANGSEVGT